MRSRTKWRGLTGKDRVKEASRKLKVILKTSRKLSISSEDLAQLEATARLQALCGRDRDAESWLFHGTLGAGFLIILLLIMFVSGALQDSICIPKNTTKDIQIQTIRIERVPLDGPLEAPEDSTLYNESEDGDDSHLRASLHLRLRRGR